jgi:hypothetical protein
MASRAPRGTLTAVDRDAMIRFLREISRTTAPLPGAACWARPGLFDAQRAGETSEEHHGWGTPPRGRLTPLRAPHQEIEARQGLPYALTRQSPAVDGRLAAWHHRRTRPVPGTSCSPSDPGTRQTVRHERPAKAHASSHHAGTSHPLSCGEADNHGEVIGRPPAQIRRFQRAGYLPLPASTQRDPGGCGEGAGGMQADPWAQ